MNWCLWIVQQVDASDSSSYQLRLAERMCQRYTDILSRCLSAVGCELDHTWILSESSAAFQQHGCAERVNWACLEAWEQRWVESLLDDSGNQSQVHGVRVLHWTRRTKGHLLGLPQNYTRLHAASGSSTSCPICVLLVTISSGLQQWAFSWLHMRKNVSSR